jgi:DNA-binding GntR family transcriptional regulator
VARANRGAKESTSAARGTADRASQPRPATGRRRTPKIGQRAPQQTPYQMVKAAILDGTFEPGVPLVEVQLAEWCGVSRTPIREALTRLEHDGLIERSDRGYVVRLRSPEEILDIYDIRIVLEAMAARLAAERHTRLDKVRITKALERWQSATEETAPGELMNLNQELHRATWLASHNQPLIDLLERLALHLGRYPATTLTAPGRLKTALAEHQHMVDAIVNRDADAAAEAATQHFSAAMRIRLEQSEEEIF